MRYFRSRHIGYIFQSFNLIPSLTALRNVMLPLIFAGLDEPAAEAGAAKVLGEVGLAHRLHHRPDELSGGQQQRVAIARALANEPAIMLADEPTANLDLHTGEEIIHILGKLCRRARRDGHHGHPRPQDARQVRPHPAGSRTARSTAWNAAKTSKSASAAWNKPHALGATATLLSRCEAAIATGPTANNIWPRMNADERG